MPNSLHWMTTAEAAAYVGARNSSTVRSWVRRGLLVPDGRLGPGGTFLFKRETLDEFVARCANTARDGR